MYKFMSQTCPKMATETVFKGIYTFFKYGSNAICITIGYFYSLLYRLIMVRLVWQYAVAHYTVDLCMESLSYRNTNSTKVALIFIILL